MSHRTDSLPKLAGLRHLIREIRYHESSRQLLALLLVALVSWFGQPTFPVSYLGVPLIAAGIAVRMWASGHIKKNKTLATDGPYAFVRHPLYVGNILILLGFGIASSRWWAFVLIALLLYAFYPPAIKYEDKKLKRLFDEEWERWQAQTAALIPSLKPYQRAASEWSFSQSLRGNGEPLIAAFLLFWLGFLLIR